MKMPRVTVLLLVALIPVLAEGFSLSLPSFRLFGKSSSSHREPYQQEQQVPSDNMESYQEEQQVPSSNMEPYQEEQQIPSSNMEPNQVEQQIPSSNMDGVLYDFGPEAGDKTTPVEDDGTSGNIHLHQTFKFFGKGYKCLYVNNNGLISFNKEVSQYTPDPFPLTDGQVFITPFWGDVDNTLGGMVYFRETTDQRILQRITRDMSIHLPDMHFLATWSFIATWHEVVFYGAATKRKNTFQAVLTTDGYRSFVILNYGRIEWTTGTASDGDGDTGLGGTAAQAGVNSGDDTHYFNIPGSRTKEVLKIASTSNVNYPGRWVLQVDDFKVPGGCVFQAKFAMEGEAFWTDSACGTKCNCKDNKVSCESVACPGACEGSGSFYTCFISDPVPEPEPEPQQKQEEEQEQEQEHTCS